MSRRPGVPELMRSAESAQVEVSGARSVKVQAGKPLSTAATIPDKVRTMKARIRQLLHASPFQPFVIRMADGREYRIDHPDFVLAAASEIPQITIEDLGGCQHYLSVLLITSIERVGAVGASGAQKQG